MSIQEWKLNNNPEDLELKALDLFLFYLLIKELIEGIYL